MLILLSRRRGVSVPGYTRLYNFITVWIHSEQIVRNPCTLNHKMTQLNDLTVSLYDLSASILI